MLILFSYRPFAIRSVQCGRNRMLVFVVVILDYKINKGCIISSFNSHFSQSAETPKAGIPSKYVKTGQSKYTFYRHLETKLN